MRHPRKDILQLLSWLIFFASLTLSFGCNKGNRDSRTSEPAKAVRPSAPQLTESESALLQAVGRGDINTVKDLLQKGVNVNLKSSDGRTPLIDATYGGYIDIVKLLLDHGAYLGSRKQDGADATMFAAGKKEISEIFQNLRALVEAAGKGDNKAVQELINKGTPVNGFDQNGHSALTEASWNGQTETVKLLLEKGANPILPKPDGATPLILANGRKQQDIVDLLNQAIRSSKSTSTETSSPAAKK